MVQPKVLEFNGEMLFPSFSIYLFEIFNQVDNKTYFYVGMTGDNYYPSARSILHRLAGHIDLPKTSTQNQFLKGLKTICQPINGTFTKEQLSALNIRLYHWPIESFEKWSGEMKNFVGTRKYKIYKRNQEKVANLEKTIIFDFKKKLFNETNGKKGILNKEYLEIYNQIKSIISAK